MTLKRHSIISIVFFLVAMISATVSAQSLPDFADLIEENSPSVVKIEVEVVREQQQMQLPPGAPDFFRRFFEERSPRGPQKGQSMGSGFVISMDGYILTNHHVVDGANAITIRFPDQSEYDAEVIGNDPSSDLALLKIDAENLTPVTFAEASPRVGEWVVAIGSPFGLDYSASAGIVSAKGRSLPTDQGTDYVPFIQTDVAINPGNSGGPLFNLEGEVVGINSQIFTRSGGYMGLSFAIPSEVALRVVEELKSSGSVTRGWLGVAIQPVTRDLAEANGLERTRGALITAIEEGSPAEQSGLEVGDIVLEFNGKQILSPGDLTHVMGLSNAGDTFDVLVMRALAEKTLEVTLGQAPSMNGEKIAGGESEVGALGVVVVDIDESSKAALSIQGGVKVKSVEANSAAAETGLQPGDVITSLNFKDIESVEQFEQIQSELPAMQKINIRFNREGRLIFRTIVIEE